MKLVKAYKDWVEYLFDEYPYEFSYNFINKSVSQLQTDWWGLSTTSWWDFTNWIHLTARNYQQIYRSIDLSRAKKVELTMTCYIDWDWSQSSWPAPDWTDGTRLLAWFISWLTSSGYNWYGINWIVLSVNRTTLSRNTTYSYKFEIDFTTNWLTFTMPWYSTRTATMSDSIATELKSMRYLQMRFEYWWVKVQTYGIKIIN